MPLVQVLRELNNWFQVRDACIHGPFTVRDGMLELPGVQVGQYVRICGSVFNDGLHQYPLVGLVDETFGGCIWPLAIPGEVLELADEIDEWERDKGQDGAFQSESFGGYTYSIKTNGEGGSWSWRDQFRSRLNQWRKL